MNDLIVALIPLTGFLAFLFGYYAQKKEWKIADFF